MQINLVQPIWDWKLSMMACEKIPGPGERSQAQLCSALGLEPCGQTQHFTELTYHTKHQTSSSPSCRTTLYTRPFFSLTQFFKLTSIFNQVTGECRFRDSRTPWPRQRTRRTLSKCPRTRSSPWWSLRTTRTEERRKEEQEIA